MCNYYRHVYASCGHTRLVFAEHCKAGARVQRPCKQRTVWQTIEVSGDCRPCGGTEDELAD
ncbi:hypothetical protein BZA05DRAFT_398436 [Tricharina praecox]|uniref:uncharacterized protein n=1 Tax=Tricharina praecox TaxID=43433 RepID=UPI00222029E1|nr:uncharacterized protein BZA05DRAFT_398436 [Tricharina praecox]KAI5851954.1 hypothetical protein BZA05DRAFT_398436 [Tricharina praecox]